MESQQSCSLTGLVQAVKHHGTDEIVGVHVVGPRAADMITEATLAVEFGPTVDDIIDTVHLFPTFSEAFKQACQTVPADHVHDELLCRVRQNATSNRHGS